MNYTVFHSGALAPDEIEFEVVERKGNGHPDTLCDRIAERISAAFSQYAEEHYGAVLRHMLDKISLRGGGAHVEFGGGHMLAPATVYLNCRFTREVEGKQVPYLEIAREQIHRTFKHVCSTFRCRTMVENRG